MENKTKVSIEECFEKIRLLYFIDFLRKYRQQAFATIRNTCKALNQVSIYHFLSDTQFSLFFTGIF
jgi:hypothetical protein